jgi:tetratricopeptide (TPR) repeat protein
VNRKKKRPVSAGPPAPGRSFGFKLVVLGLASVVVGAGLGLLLRDNRSRPPTSSGVSSSRPAGVESDAEVFAQYAGSASCRECHVAAFDAWKGSHHAWAERTVDAKLDEAAFQPAKAVKHGPVTSEVRIREDRFEILTAGSGGEVKPFTAERIIGVTPLRQCLVAAPGGRLQVTELAFDPGRGDWFDIFGDEDRRPGEWGHWTGRGMNWNQMCAACHNTRVRKNFKPKSDTYATAMAERGVSCEACHGPMKAHVEWQKKNPAPGYNPEHAGQNTGTNTASPRKIARSKDPTLRPMTRDQTLATCGTCHARRGELTGDFKPGDNFFDHFTLTIPDDTDLFYPDGQVREEDYEFTSFLSSKMYVAGVRCLDCHQPHTSKTILADNALCLRCHTPPIPPAPKIEPAAHSHHAPDQPGGRCVDCHMPQTTYMQRHARRDHGFTIPDPLLTKQHNIPNACNRCHTDRTADWALEAVETWYGAQMNRPTRARAQWVAAARDGQTNAHVNLLRMLTTENIPLWRATAAGLLRRWSGDPMVQRPLLKSARDADPLVRAMVARAIEPLVASGDTAVDAMLRELLYDPIRNVRAEAAWALRARLDTNVVAVHDLLRSLEFNRDQPSGLMQVGIWHMDRSQLPDAVACFRQAVEWDQGSAPLRHTLAVALSLQGQPAEAVRELEEACRLAPKEAEYRFKLGLALNEAGRANEVTAALKEAVKLEPQHAPAWYNLGLAYSSLEQPERALEALSRAETLNPGSAQIPFARATIHARLGQNEEARRAAQRALELQPGHGEAAALLRALVK